MMLFVNLFIAHSTLCAEHVQKLVLTLHHILGFIFLFISELFVPSFLFHRIIVDVKMSNPYSLLNFYKDGGDYGPDLVGFTNIHNHYKISINEFLVIICGRHFRSQSPFLNLL